MKTLAYQRYKYTGDLFKSIKSIVGDAETFSFYFVGTITLTIGMNDTGRMIVRCSQPIAIGSIISKIKDAKNDLILDDISWQITGLQPVLNAFGNVEEYRMIVNKYIGTL